METALSHPHLRALLTDAEAVRAAATSMRDTLTDAQRTWRPSPEAWSVADCFEHLRKVDKGYARQIRAALDGAPSGEAPYQPSWFGKRFIRFVSPESTFRLKAPRGVRPSAAESSAAPDALDRFLEQQAEVHRLIREADGKDLNRTKFSSPIAAILRLSLGEGLTLVVRHDERHLGQAQRVTQHPDFPSDRAVA